MLILDCEMLKALDFDSVDFNEVYKLVLDASRKAFRDIQQAHPDEMFYTFGFYQHHFHARLGFMLPTCHSEEAHMRLMNLTEADRENQTLEWFYRRWQSDQWDYHYSGQEHFVPAWEWVNNALIGYVRPRDQEMIRANIAHNMLMIYLKVLKVLDDEKLFGQGSARHHVVLIMGFDVGTGHDDMDQYEYVRSLNSEAGYERWCIEMDMHDYAFKVFDGISHFDSDDE